MERQSHGKGQKSTAEGLKPLAGGYSLVRTSEERGGMSEPEQGGTPRVHPEAPAEGADEDLPQSDAPDVPRRHTQEPAEGAEEPGEPR